MSDLDVVLFGPTGVTGREVARYLSQRAPALGLTWAAAGRDRGRVAAALDEVGAAPDEILHADVDQPTTISAMVERARVVANLVGPYARFGEPVYEACARTGTHEVDLTGEIDWVRTMMGSLDDVATEHGAKIVPTCGFEALPFDLGALLAAQTLHERTGDPVASVDVAASMWSTGRVTSLTDAVSGGTFASMIDVLRRGLGDVATDPYYLDPPGEGTSGRYDTRPRKHPVTGDWLAPMFPSHFLNPPVAHRSAALLRASGDDLFAPGYRYVEGAAASGMAPSLFTGPLSALLSLGTGLAGLAGRLPDQPRQALADRLLAVGPKSGDGPRPEDLDTWTYRLDIRATDVRGGTQDVAVEADGHPGYKSTATMIGEAALALADTMSGVPDGAGFLTPATALGMASLDRMVHAGVRFVAVD